MAGSWAVLSGLGWLLGRPKWPWVLSGWPWSRPWVGPGSPQFRALRDPVRFHCIYIYIYTRVDPCIKCTRSKLDTGQGFLGLLAPEDLLSVCCLVLPLVLSSVVLSPLVSSCLGFSALVSSCVVCWASPGPFLGLSRASLGAHFGLPEGHFEAPGGSWALGVTLGGSWVSLSPPLGCSRPLWGRPGGFLGLLWGVLGGSWPLKASFHETP